MAKRYTIEERVYSDYGQGIYPGHRFVSYLVFDKQDKVGGPIRDAATREAAEESIKILKKRGRK